MNKSNELTSIRQDKAYLKREISKIRNLPDFDIHQQQKAQLPILEDELNDLVSRENQLLGKSETGKLVDPSTQPTPTAERGWGKIKWKDLRVRGFKCTLGATRRT